MSSTYTILPLQHLDGGRLGMTDPRLFGTQENDEEPHELSLPPDTSGRLSPNTLQHPNSSAFVAYQSNHHVASVDSTPGSVQYQSSDFSTSECDEEFVGVDFGDLNGGIPSFLGGAHMTPEAGPSATVFDNQIVYAANNNNYNNNNPSILALSTRQTYPPSPEPSLHTISPPSRHYSGHDDRFAASSNTTAPNKARLLAQSPQVTVSMWRRDDDAAEEAQSMFAASLGAAMAMNSNMGISTIPLQDGATTPTRVARDAVGRWLPDASTGLGGLAPSSRSLTKTASLNDLAAARADQDRNKTIDRWLSHSNHSTATTGSSGSESHCAAKDCFAEGVPDRDISLGHETSNVIQAGQVYLRQDGSGQMLREDADIVLASRVWGDAATILPISDPKAPATQPETAQGAINRFEEACRDNGSIVSRAATWGTRRRSLPSVVDMEGIISGNWVKKLSISRSEPKKANVFFKDLCTLVTNPSATTLANLKRTLTSQDDEDQKKPSIERQESGSDRLVPPFRSPSWTKRTAVPNINTALVGIGSNIAAIGATHARSGSISSAAPALSPKSPFGLKVQNTISRRRAKSDLPPRGKPSSIADMWKKSGGPPVANLAKPAAPADQDASFEEDDDFDDSDSDFDRNKQFHDIAPTLEGFQEYILKLNPMLAHTNTYLVERIARQQIVRYEALLKCKIKHMKSVRAGNCECGRLCIELGGSAIPLENRPGLESCSPTANFSDGESSPPMESSIGSFRPYIPTPPTQVLPAEFECQICFQPKKFQKPSDWTKHVHEDVQPFTCTWENCRDPKVFKRKADWVRHENEGHRHLEWWRCDVEGCGHTCYRRDNFLQHLVREHKCVEPKHKTKAAIKRAGGNDQTLQRVERCHADTLARPQDEPCRFCNKTFPSWKKLTVHLADHMEQINLPILKLVAEQDIDADTIMSSAQEIPQMPLDPPPPPPQRDVSQAYFRSLGGLPHQPSAVKQQMYSPVNYPAKAQDFPMQALGLGPPFTEAGFVQDGMQGQFGTVSGLGGLHGSNTTTAFDMSHINPATDYQAPLQTSYPELLPSARTYSGSTTPQRHEFSIPVATAGVELLPQMLMGPVPFHHDSSSMATMQFGGNIRDDGDGPYGGQPLPHQGQAPGPNYYPQA